MLKESTVFGGNNIYLDTNKFYYLMCFNEKVLKFNSIYHIIKGYEVLEIYDRNLVPFVCKDNIENFTNWLADRPIPTNQEHLHRVLDSLQMTSRNVMDLLKVNSGFSLNDAYWIKPCSPTNYNVEMSWEKNNLYDNSFDEALGLVTFFGNQSSLGGTLNTPEITNQGSVGKAWRRINGELIMYKKTSEGAANLGKDHFSEVIATKILDIIGLDHVRYWLSSWHGKECSCSKIFTSKDIGYLPMYQYLMRFGVPDTEWNYAKLSSLLPSEYDRQMLDDMIVFDFIIENWDRHFSNFGFLINNRTQDIIKFAPIFDNGYSLMCRDLDYDFKDRDYLEYSKVNTFKLVTNKDIATYVIGNNPRRYKEWAKLIMIRLSNIIIEDAPSWYMYGVLDLVQSRCKYIQTL